ncbi:1437_t:CDS:2, partial [Acaulospora colombiana]
HEGRADSSVKPIWHIIVRLFPNGRERQNIEICAERRLLIDPSRLFFMKLFIPASCQRSRLDESGVGFAETGRTHVHDSVLCAERSSLAA